MQKFSFDKHIEECIIQALLSDHNFGEQLLEVLDVEYFNLEHTKECTKMIFDYYKKYNGSFPSVKLMASMAKEMENEPLKEKIIAYLIRIAKEEISGDMDYVKDAVLDFCKKKALAIALENSLDLIGEKKYEQILPEVQKALLAGSERDVGHVYADGFEKRMEAVKRNPVPSPWREINDITGNGLSGGELGIIMANSGIGKSHCLVNIACNAAKLGFNVSYYTFELSDIYVGKRCDSNFSDIPFDDLCSQKEIVRNSIKDIKGQIVIKAYPAKSVGALTIKNHTRQLTLRGKKPDVILVDSVDLLRSSRQYEQKRLEEECATEELRALAQELNIPIWTVTQSNRSGLEAEVLTQKHIAECYGKYMISDFFLTMNRQKDGTNKTIGNFFVCKNRMGSDGKKYNIMVDTSVSKFEILKDDELSSGGVTEEKIDAYELLKRRFKSMQKEGKLS